ncbi:unnamed protein product [Closterium sp. Naga37s-1]|nr:unnamed protein product [Closterium sp. Naga37s-1]
MLCFSRLDILARVTPAAAAEAAAAEAAAEAAQGDVSFDGSYDDTTASFGAASYRLAGTFETDCSYDAGENLLEGVILSKGRHALFAPLAAWTEESILRLERIKAYGALRNNKPRPVEKEEQRNKEQRNRRGNDLYSKLPAASVRARRAAGIGCCFAGGVGDGEEAEDSEGAEDSLPAREAGGKLAEGIARLRMGWARARDGAEEAEGVRAQLLAHAVLPAERGDVGAQDGGRGGDERMKRDGPDMLRDARISGEPSSNSRHNEIEPADTPATHESSYITASDTGASYGTRSTTAATSAAEPRVVLPHLYSKVPVSGEGSSVAGWGRWEGETCIQEEEGEDEYWRERADDAVAGAGAGSSDACVADSTREEARDMGARTRPSSPTHHTTSPAASTIPATDAAAAGTAARALRWFASVRASGAALELMNAQTEVLPVRLGGMDGDKLAKMAQYGKWTVKTNDEQRGDHISVLRAVRLWLVPDSEVELTLVLASGGVNNAACPPDWGLLLEQTLEGVVHVVGVRGGSPAEKGGVAMLLRMARAKKRLLLLSRLQGQVLLPSVIANGQIDCADVEALQEQLVLQAHLPSIPLRLTFAL